MLQEAVLATESGWIVMLLWPILLLLLGGWVVIRLLGRWLVDVDHNKPLHQRREDADQPLPDAWSESARRLKLDETDEDDSPPMEDKPRRPDRPE